MRGSARQARATTDTVRKPRPWFGRGAEALGREGAVVARRGWCVATRRPGTSSTTGRLSSSGPQHQGAPRLRNRRQQRKRHQPAPNARSTGERKGLQARLGQRHSEAEPRARGRGPSGAAQPDPRHAAQPGVERERWSASSPAVESSAAQNSASSWFPPEKRLSVSRS